MAETTTATPEAPAAPVQPSPTPEAPAAPKVESPSTESSQTPEIADDLSLEQLQAVLDQAESGTKPETESAERPTETETKPPTKQAKTPEPPPVTEQEEETDDEPARNYRFHTEDIQKRKFLRLLKQNPDANPAELAKLVGYEIPKGEQGAPPTETPPAATTNEPEPPPEPASLVEQRNKVADLEAKLEEAEKNYQPTAKLISELQKANLALDRAETAHRNEVAAQADFDTKADKAAADAIRMCPETGRPGTPQFEEIDVEVTRMKMRNDPLLNDPNYPVEVLRRVAKRRPDLFPNVLPKPQAATPVATPVPTPPTARPNGQVESPNAGNQPRLAPKDAAREIDNLSLEELEALADMTGTQHRKAG